MFMETSRSHTPLRMLPAYRKVCLLKVMMTKTTGANAAGEKQHTVSRTSPRNLDPEFMQPERNKAAEINNNMRADNFFQFFIMVLSIEVEESLTTF